MTRRGFSLLEIMLALAIFGGAMAVLSGLIDTGVRAAIEAQDLSRAQMLCESQLEQFLMQTGTPVSVPEAVLDTGDPSRVWSYMIEVVPSPAANIHVVRVTVRAAPPGLSNGQEASYSLIRWMPDPSLNLDVPVSTETTTTTTPNASASTGVSP